ncbi:hypothetical protein K2173_015011 [Erythroxylum novogranatense]|uniref:Cytochrome P450 n=1 Tax=Erythroxylum novogranatense TaxID=1862640 RepID=A0AAV8TTW3_9ROSI|nr:hypothetical protein K2173_015011 [Erythroxylum novogranatense]
MEFSLFLHYILLLIVFALSFYLYLVFPQQQKKPSNNNVDGFRIYPIVGALPDFWRNRRRFLDWTVEVLSNSLNNTAYFVRPIKLQGLLTASPSNVEYILKTNFENYTKGKRFTSILEDFLGQGIFNSDGDLWKVQRKTASYEFNTRSLRNFVMDNVKAELSTRLIPILSRAAEMKKVVDFQDLLERFAFDNICKVAFNVDPACLGRDGTAGSEFMQAFEEAALLSSNRFLSVFQLTWKFKKFFNLGTERKLKRSISAVHKFADQIIRSRMEEKTDKKDEDLLSRFIGNFDRSPEFLRDIVISFILAGRDTTSSALSSFFLLLSSNPNVQRNILKELEATRALSGKKIGDTYSFDELRDMQYLHAAISEALRLYPPVAINTKACNVDDTLPDGTVVRKGWFVTYVAYAMGRMENLWGEDCREFKPERWLENGICRHKSSYKFSAFHAGPRVCLGKDMAYIQMKSIAASVIERFEIDVLDKDKNPERVLSLTLRMKDGWRVRVKERITGASAVES